MIAVVLAVAVAALFGRLVLMALRREDDSHETQEPA